MVQQKPLPADEEYEMMDEEQRQQFIEDYYRGAFAHAGYKPTFRQKTKRSLGSLYGAVLSLVIIAIVYGLINLVVVGVQEFWHHDAKSKMSDIKAELSLKESKINNYELHVNDGTISDTEYADYSRLIDEYNGQVKEYNDLAEKAGTTWYVVPIPGGKH